MSNQERLAEIKDRVKEGFIFRGLTHDQASTQIDENVDVISGFEISEEDKITEFIEQTILKLKDEGLEIPKVGIPSSPSVQIVRGIQMEKTQLSEEDQVIVRLTNPEIKSGGLMSGKNLFFDISTQPLGWKVKRKYADFEWLMSTLKKRFPANYVKNIE